MTGDERNQEHLSLDEAARALETTPLNVLMHLKRGFLAGEEVDGVWWIDAASLAAWLRRRGAESTPALCRSGCGARTGGCGSCG